MRSRRRVLRKVRSPREYCGYTDDGGYCCTSLANPGVIWCQPHQLMMRQPYRNILPAIWTNPLTAEASQKALENPTPVGAATAAAARVTLPGSAPPPSIKPTAPPVPLGQAIRGFPSFKFLEDHWGVADWTAEVVARPKKKSSENQSKLAEYIISKVGIDVGDSLDQISSGNELKLTASAGVAFVDIVCEVSAREYLWKWHPYLQVLLMKSGGTADEQRVKRLNMIDALCESADVDEDFDSLFSKARLKVASTGLDINRLKHPPFPDLLPDPNSRDIVTNVLLGRVSELSSDPAILSMPAPDLSNLGEAIKRSRERMKTLNSKLFCAGAGATTFDKTCEDWVRSKVSVMTTVPANLQEYADFAEAHVPEFISLIK